jgi:acyl-coenzyme A synthetase/AMP-(fatty) acid ligase
LTTITIDAAADIAGLGLPDLRLVTASPDKSLAGLAAACAAAGVRLEAVSPDGERPLDLGFGPDHPYGGHVLQTSGTTGAYKKILFDPGFEDGFLAHRRRMNLVDQGSVVSVFSFHPRTGVGYKSPASTWAVGGSVVIQTRGEAHETLRHPGLTHAITVPAQLDAILAAPADAFAFNPDLHLSITAGTASQARIDETKTRIAGRVFNGLGATEAHAIAYTLLERPEDRRWHRPVQGSGVEIVDEAGQPTEVGQIGQVRVSTAGGPTGYLGDAATSREFFRGGYFYPGDLAERRADGRFALQGRVSEVINVRGHKIAPAPIEDRLCEALGLKGACLVSRQNADGDEVIHVVIEAAEPPPMDRLTAALRADLAGVAQIRLHWVKALPRNAMGKVMRGAVRDTLTG